MRALASVLAPLLLASCASSPAGWDVGALEERHPGVGDIADHRLGESIPYFALSTEGVALFLCRWETAEPVPVWWSADLPAEESAILTAALAAWEGAGLGVRFDPRTGEGEPPLEGIVIEIIEPDTSLPATNTASTVADCAIPMEVAADGVDGGDARVDAVLAYASIHLRRSLPDLVGRPVPLSSSELLGAAVHELGHALGFPGHVSGGGSILSAHGQVDAARRWGRRLEEGRSLEEPTLAALYAAPSGARVGWLPLSRSGLDPVRALTAVASSVGLRGPYTRVGSESARILWRDPKGNSTAVIVLEWPSVLSGATRFEPRLNRSARLLLERASGR